MKHPFYGEKIETLIDGAQNRKENYLARRIFIKDTEERKTTFAKYYKQTALNEKWIFYESMGGVRMMDNPYAIFKRVFGDKRFKDYIHVWSIANYDTIPQEYRDKGNILFVTRNTDMYMRAIATAQYVVCNSVLPEYFVRKPGQKYLNTWHGIAYKGIGRSELSLLGPMGTIYNMLEATHVLTPCDFMTQKQLFGFSMQGVYSGQIAEIGYPRIDTTINASTQEKERIQQTLKIDTNKKVVLYAPTWRGDMRIRKFDTDTLTNDLKALAKLDANIIFMGHHLMLKHTKGYDFSNLIVPPSSINTNGLLSIVDVLITDYSSIFFDFLVTARPIIHYLYDYDEYKRERGLSLEKSELPGTVVQTTAELIASVEKHLATPYAPTKRYEQARKRFCLHEDGAVSKRAVEWFFKNDVSGINIVPKDKKQSIVFWGGALNKTDNAMEYLQKIKDQVKKDDKIVVLVIARSVVKRPEIMSAIRSFGYNVTIIARGDDTMIATKTEKVARHLIEHGIRGWGRIPFVRLSYTRMYEREHRRILGSARFDEVIVYPKCSRFWKELAKYAS